MLQIQIDDKPQWEDKMRSATCWEDWRLAAENLDRIKENDRKWTNEEESTIYDFGLIRERTDKLQKAREAGNTLVVAYHLRSGLLRNLGALNDIRLYSHHFVHTKQLIEDYHSEVEKCIEYIKSQNLEAKFDKISDTCQSFGRTALVLHGGASFALYHIGVAKALFERNLLPRIISGSSISALIAALICIHSDDELPAILCETGIDLSAFHRKDPKGGFYRKMYRLFREGHLLDSEVFTQCVNDNLKDVTFEEAFLKSGRVLNIVVSSARKNEIPRLLNYLTAPNVLVRTAACASASSVGIFQSVNLLAKEKDGVKIVPWGSTEIKWADAPYDGESPETRLAEQFNVNHFIVSQSSIISTQFLPKGPQNLKTTFFEQLKRFMFNEFRHRVSHLGHFRLLPLYFTSLFSHKILGHVTISPVLDWHDFRKGFANPDVDAMKYWISLGERTTWPYIELIRNRLRIELALQAAKQTAEVEIRAREAQRALEGHRRLEHVERRPSLNM
ncbi:hypothetical protein HDU98_004788 [Podochytrium sp. JEL0797]|nr:hypothetical protein HDU98_004788 [Podochytrium sp. JEL0797]